MRFYFLFKRFYIVRGKLRDFGGGFFVSYGELEEWVIDSILGNVLFLIILVWLFIDFRICFLVFNCKLGESWEVRKEGFSVFFRGSVDF